MKKRSNNRQGLSSDARLWLDGKPCGFFEFKPDDELQALWDANGDESKMFWRRGVSLPITLDDLESREDAWLGSALNDEYGMNSFFIYRFYDDDEKKKLFESRGDHESYYYRKGLRRPQPIGETEAGE
jgi:hypothetical protein